MKRIYLSGKISGLSRRKYRYNFFIAYKAVKELYPQAYIVDPTRIKPLFGIDAYWCYMVADITYLLTCDTISMQPNWKESRGAKIELAISILTNKKIIWL